MTIAFLTDTHTGARSSSNIFREYMKFWYEEHFFAELERKGIKEIIHGGDFFDNRNSISLQDIDFIVNWFANKLIDGGYKMTIVLGNHDIAFKNTNRVHSLSMLQAAAPNNVRVIEDPVLTEIDGQHYALIPWINNSNYDATVEFLANIPGKPSVIVVGHFEIAGAKMYANSSLCDHGLDAEMFNQFKEVWSGHFHHKSTMGNIRYMGSAFHLNWQDYGDARGYHLFDSATDELTFVENEYCLFVQVVFDKDIFSKMTDDEFLDAFNSRFVRVIVDGEYDKVALLDTITKINRASPHDLQIVNHQVLKESAESVADDIEVKTAKSTLEYIQTVVESHTDEVKALIKILYDDANEKMLKGE